MATSSNKDTSVNILNLTGKGQVSVDPDIAILHLGVQTTGNNLTVVQSENAMLSQAVLQTLKQMGIADLKTYEYNIEKLYQYENGIRIDKGYSVRNILEIHMKDINQVGVAIDNAVNSGANIIDYINFEVSNSYKYYQEALNLALKSAIDKAKSIANVLGANISLLPIRITENSTPPMLISNRYQAKDDAQGTPIEYGNKQIEASVTVEFLYD